jgi:hypothetical protein
MTVNERVQKQAEEVRAARDEIRVRLHLAKMDARDQWELVEKQWEHAEAKLRQLANTANEANDDIVEATELLLNEIRDGYKKLRSLI